MKIFNWFSILAIVLVYMLTGCGQQRIGIIDIKFTTQLTQSDLDKIQEDLKSQNIDLTYDKLEFDERGNLKKISVSIDYNDGQRGSFESRVLESTDRPGFYRDFSKD